MPVFLSPLLLLTKTPGGRFEWKGGGAVTEVVEA